MATQSKREEYAEATKNALMEAALALFSSKGYNDTSLGQIVEEAKVTKGAFYHHFKSKQTIFEACYEKQAAAVALAVGKIENQDDVWDELLARCEAFLAFGAKRGGHAIRIQEAIIVLGWDKWRKLDESRTIGVLTDSVKRLMSTTSSSNLSINLIVDMIYGMLVNAMMTLSTSKNKKQTKQELILLLKGFLQSIVEIESSSSSQM